MHLSVSFEGQPRLACSTAGATVSDLRFDVARWLDVELVVDGRRLEGRVWPSGCARPVDPTLSLDLERDLPPLRFLGLTAAHDVGGILEVDRVSVDF